MSYKPPYVKNITFTAPLTTDQIRANLITEITNNNPNFTDLAGSPQNLLVDEGTYVLAFNQQSYINVLAGIFPAYTTDWQLQNLGVSVGLPQKTTQQLSVVVTFNGTIGTFIPQNTIVQNTVNTVTVLTTEATTLSKVSQDIICITQIGTNINYIAPNSLTVLPSAIAGITSTNNSNAGYGLTTPESNEDYRTRLYQGFTLNKSGCVPQALSIIKSVKGVNPRLVSIPLNSDGTINPIIGGGAEQDIANALYISALGIATINSVATSGTVVSYTLVDGGTSYTASWVQPAINSLSFVVNYSLPSGVNPLTFQSIVGTSLVEYVNQLQVGQPLNTLNMYNYCLLSIVNNGITDVSLISVLNFSNFLVNGTPVEPSIANGNLYNIDSDAYFDITLSAIGYNNV